MASSLSNISPEGTDTASPKSDKPLPNPSRRRDKPQLSCNLCRRRKLKCDRGQPCGTCARRGLSLSCTYVNSNISGKTTQLSAQGNSNLHERIEQLEKLVISLATSSNAAKPGLEPFSSSIQGNTADSSHSSNSENLSQNLGRINLEDDEARYVEGTHWTSILDGISELKDYLDGGVKPETVQKTIANLQGTSKPTLLNPAEHNISKQEILAEIPPKAVVDRLIAKCFTHVEVLHILLHAPTFQKQYDNFWKQPHLSPIMWIGILYGMMCMGTQYEFFAMPSLDQNPTPMLPVEAQNQVETYRQKMIQCMALGGYTKGVPHSIETLQIYLQVEFLGNLDSPTEFWLLLGIIIRLAYRLGYHRDGSQFPNITPFEAEMRRRRWCLILQMETMASSQFGLPKMIKEYETDVAPPRNLFDEDFDELTKMLPESRPITTITPSLYLITKTKLFSIFGRISESNFKTIQPSYAEVMTLDKSLDDFRENMPPGFQMRSMTQSIIDKPELIFQRVWITVLYLKSKCVLHRRYLRVGRADKRCAYSRNVCIDSALQILNLQAMLYEESLPNGRLFQDRWRLSSLIKQEYLLATAILCVDVYTDLELEVSSTERKYPVDKKSRYRILNGLKSVQLIWEQESGGSLEAKKATSILQLVLGKAEKVEAARRPQDGSSSASSISNQTEGFTYGFSSSPECNFVTSKESSASGWESFISTPPLLHETWSDANYITPLTESVDFNAIQYDFPPLEFQAQDLMDILQDDYPGMIL